MNYENIITIETRYKDLNEKAIIKQDIETQNLRQLNTRYKEENDEIFPNICLSDLSLNEDKVDNFYQPQNFKFVKRKTFIEEEFKLQGNTYERDFTEESKQKKKGWTMQSFIIEKFRNILKSYTTNALLRQFNIQKLIIFDDNAVNPDYYLNEKNKKTNQYYIQGEKQNLIQYVSYYFLKKVKNQFFTHLLEQSYLFTPDSLVCVIWESILCVCIIINIIFLPMMIIFKEDEYANFNLPNFGQIFFDQITGAIMLINIPYKFNTAYYHDCIIVQNRSKIIKNYLKTEFFNDIIVVLGIVLAIITDKYEFYLLIFFKIGQIMKILQNFIDMLNLKLEYQTYIDLLKLILLIIFVAHVLGCAFFYLYIYEKSQGITENWIQKQNQVQSEWREKYVTCLYWAVITMITVGYGDVTPVTVQEKTFVIIVTFIGCGVFAFAVNFIGMVLSDFNMKSIKQKQMISQVCKYTQKRGLSSQLQLKLKKYLIYINEKQNDNTSQFENIQNQLSHSLKEQILKEIYLKILKSQKFFNLNFSEELLEQLALKLKEIKITDDYIVKEGEITDKLYILQSGKVQNFLAKKHFSSGKPQTIIENSIHKGQIFGLYSFFSGLPCIESTKSLNVASLVYINLTDFLQVLKDHPLDYEVYCMIRDHLQQKGFTMGIEQYCQFCNKYQHSIKTCPQITLKMNPRRIFAKLRNSGIQNRNKMFKRKRQNKKTYQRNLACIHLNRERLLDFLYDFYPDCGIRDNEIIKLMENIEEQDIDRYVDESEAESEGSVKSLDREIQLSAKQKQLMKSSKMSQQSQVSRKELKNQKSKFFQKQKSEMENSKIKKSEMLIHQKQFQNVLDLNTLKVIQETEEPLKLEEINQQLNNIVIPFSEPKLTSSNLLNHSRNSSFEEIKSSDLINESQEFQSQKEMDTSILKAYSKQPKKNSIMNSSLHSSKLERLRNCVLQVTALNRFKRPFNNNNNQINENLQFSNNYNQAASLFVVDLFDKGENFIKYNLNNNRDRVIIQFNDIHEFKRNKVYNDMRLKYIDKENNKSKKNVKKSNRRSKALFLNQSLKSKN